MKIGFKNFKKFKDFPMIELAPITLLVGPNNSGKSSFIKALTFFFYNLKHLNDSKYWNSIPEDKLESIEITSQWIKEVSFYHLTLSHLGWGDFEVCLNKSDKTNKITFSIEDDFEKDVIYEFSFGASYSEIEKDPSLLFTLPITSWRTIIRPERIEIKTHLHDGIWLTSINFNKNEWIPSISKIIEGIKSKIQKGEMDPEKGERIVKNEEELMSRILNNPGEIGKIEYIVENKDSIIFQTLWNEINKYKLEGPDICFSEIEYIEAHNAHHSQALLADNKNDYLAQTIIEFFSTIDMEECSIESSYDNFSIYQWCCRKLRDFEVCDNFHITPLLGGEVFNVTIRKSNPLESSRKGGLVNLSTLGTGSIRLFLLVLRIGLVLRKLEKLNKQGLDHSQIVVFVEEPEQNLHPKLQSQLADLFKEVHKKTNGRVRFIVETHSEYLIRRTQVLVAKEQYADEEELVEKNPFKVYYFPKEGLPYDMKYQTSGRFGNKFGEGFFDESAKWHMEILKKEKSRK